MTILHDLKFALRYLARAKGLSATVILTLALGIGANAAIFSVVRGVLMRPLANRDESRLIYIRQSALGIGTIGNMKRVSQSTECPVIRPTPLPQNLGHMLGVGTARSWRSS